MSEIFFDSMNIIVDVGPIFTDEVSMFWCEFADKKLVSIQCVATMQNSICMQLYVYS